MVDFNECDKKSGGKISLPSWENIPNDLPELGIPTKSYDNNLPFFEAEQNIFEESDLLPTLRDFSVNENTGPIFVRTDDYKKVLDCVDSMKSYAKESPDIIMMLKNLEKNQHIEHNKFIKNLEDIQRKLIYIDNLLFEAMKE